MTKLEKDFLKAEEWVATLIITGKIRTEQFEEAYKTYCEFEKQLKEEQ